MGIIHMWMNQSDYLCETISRTILTSLVNWFGIPVIVSVVSEYYSRIYLICLFIFLTSIYWSWRIMWSGPGTSSVVEVEQKAQSFQQQPSAPMCFCCVISRGKIKVWVVNLVNSASKQPYKSTISLCLKEIIRYHRTKCSDSVMWRVRKYHIKYH